MCCRGRGQTFTTEELSTTAPQLRQSGAAPSRMLLNSLPAPQTPSNCHPALWPAHCPASPPAGCPGEHRQAACASMPRPAAEAAQDQHHTSQPQHLRCWWLSHAPHMHPRSPPSWPAQCPASPSGGSAAATGQPPAPPTPGSRSAHPPLLSPCPPACVLQGRAGGRGEIDANLTNTSPMHPLYALTSRFISTLTDHPHLHVFATSRLLRPISVWGFHRHFVRQRHSLVQDEGRMQGQRSGLDECWRSRSCGRAGTEGRCEAQLPQRQGQGRCAVL